VPRARRAATVRGSGAGANWLPMVPSRLCGGVRAWMSTTKERIDLNRGTARRASGGRDGRARRKGGIREVRGEAARWIAPSGGGDGSNRGEEGLGELRGGYRA